jgi:hypothetical protein
MRSRDFYCCLPVLSNAHLVRGLGIGQEVNAAINTALNCNRMIHCEFRLACSCLVAQLMEQLVQSDAA